MKPWQCALCEASSAGTAVKRSKRRRALCDWCDAELTRRGLDWCTRGKHKIAADDLCWNGRTCRDCDRARARSAYGKYAEARRAYARSYYAANRERELAHDAAYRATHRDAVRAQQRRRYIAKRDVILARNRAYYIAHRERIRARHAAWRAANPGANALSTRRYRARRYLQILRGWRKAA